MLFPGQLRRRFGDGRDVVYTTAAKRAQGGTTAMRNLIDSAIIQTNSTYANSTSPSV